MNVDQLRAAVNLLVPGAQCAINEVAGVATIIEWHDQRAQPGQQALDDVVTRAITNAGVDAQISALEFEQMKRITPRGDREFRLAVYQALATLPGLGGLANHPAFVALKAIDDGIRAQRAQRT